MRRHVISLLLHSLLTGCVCPCVLAGDTIHFWAGTCHRACLQVGLTS